MRHRLRPAGVAIGLTALTVVGLRVAAPALPTSGSATLLGGAGVAALLTVLLLGASPFASVGDRREARQHAGARARTTRATGAPLSTGQPWALLYTTSVFVGCWVVLLAPGLP